MNGRELAKELERRSGVKGYLIERALKSLGPVMHEVLGKGGSVTLSSMGRFYKGKHRSSKTYNLKGGPKTSPAHTPVVFGVAGKYKKLPG